MLVVTFFYGIFMLPAILSFVDLQVFKIYGKIPVIHGQTHDEEEAEMEKSIDLLAKVSNKPQVAVEVEMVTKEKKASSEREKEAVSIDEEDDNQPKPPGSKI